MGQIPDLPEDFTPPPGMVALPVRLKATRDKLDFHLDLTSMDAGVAVEPHFTGEQNEPVGFTLYFHGLPPGALVETLTVALQAAHELEERYQIHMAQHHADEN